VIQLAALVTHSLTLSLQTSIFYLFISINCLILPTVFWQRKAG